MTERKPDADHIHAHIERLKTEKWLGPARQWWPNYLFFFADLPNALSILRDGKLVCRSRAPMAVDTGAREVLDRTPDQWKDCVRLYFRPRTPTQHQVEGFRPKHQLDSLRKHMALPIFFLFDAKDILTRKTTRYSGGNLSQDPPVGGDALFFQSLPFEQIYHDSWMSEDEKSTIKFRRHAEVIIPHELDLAALKRIWCRSEAEYQTLMQLLPGTISNKYKTLIGQGKRPSLHFGKWTFVEAVTLQPNAITFAFNQSTLTPRPFTADLRITNLATGQGYKWENPEFQAAKPLTVNIRQMQNPVPYELRFTLDEKIAFAGRFDPKLGPVLT